MGARSAAAPHRRCGARGGCGAGAMCGVGRSRSGAGRGGRRSGALGGESTGGGGARSSGTRWRPGCVGSGGPGARCSVSFSNIWSVRFVWHLTISWTVTRRASDTRVAGTPFRGSAHSTSCSRPRRVAGDTAGARAVRGNQRPRKTRKQRDAVPAAPRSARPRPARRALTQSSRWCRLPPPPPQSAPSWRGYTRQVRPQILEQALRAFEDPARHLQSPLIPLLSCAHPHFS